MLHTWLEISKDALYSNIINIKKLIGNVRMSVVLKGNAYGHGLIPMASLLQEHADIEALFVMFGYEALQLRACGITKKIVVLTPLEDELIDCIAQNIELVCCDIQQMFVIEKAAATLGKKASVHLKIDTGMSRLGVLPSEMDELLLIMKSCCYANVVAIMTHLSDADDVREEAESFTKKQITIFNGVIERYAQYFPSLCMVHIGASSSIVFFSQGNQWIFELATLNSMLRIATNIFGYYKPGAQKQRLHNYSLACTLKPILTWKARIIHLKTVSVGSVIGYGRTYTSDKEMRIAVIPIGYADGYLRDLSNCGQILVRGVLVPVVGRVSMNLCTLDVSSVPDVKVGDEVSLLGPQQGITADDLASKIGGFNIVLLVALRESLERIIVK